MTRIRYKKDGTKLISVKPIICNNTAANIIIHLDKMKYQIINLVNEQVIAEGTAQSPYLLKRDAKNLAKTLGANFLDEIRKPERKFVLSET